ncbi:transposase [Methylobacterium sp. AMS5]|nr:transposase [Methylobacterium sp. AMS5]
MLAQAPGRVRRLAADKRRYRERWRIEATFDRLKDFRRIATRYDTLARNYASAVALAAVIAFRC